uniref:Uncharacterized protein n=1 Tax=Anguilla anguilla TaxID=7936 RepID=A0A0E9WD91_ANGAN
MLSRQAVWCVGVKRSRLGVRSDHVQRISSHIVTGRVPQTPGPLSVRRQLNRGDFVILHKIFTVQGYRTYSMGFAIPINYSSNLPKFREYMHV